MRPPTLTVVTAVAFVVGALTYSVWISGWWVNPTLNARTSYVSELAARDEPYSAWFRSADAAAGLIFAVGALVQLVAWRRAQVPGTALALISMVLATIFGIATVVDAASPLGCTPTQDAVCKAAEDAGTVSVSHQFHLVSSSVAATAAVVMIITMSWWMHKQLPHSSRSVAVNALAIVTVVASGWTLAAIALEPHTLGIAQRLQIAAISAWMLVFVWRMRPTDLRPHGAT